MEELFALWLFVYLGILALIAFNIGKEKNNFNFFYLNFL
jgi:hypothetical protein